MKFLTLAMATSLQWSLVCSLVVERRNPTDSHDRGTWHLDCTKAAGACNNACFSVVCLQQDTKKMYFDSGSNNDANRKSSGCQAPNSVCNAMPFSQKLNDPQELKKPSCDEWPMAEVKNDNNKAPNVLRCIEQSENSCKGVSGLLLSGSLLILHSWRIAIGKFHSRRWQSARPKRFWQIRRGRLLGSRLSKPQQRVSDKSSTTDRQQSFASLLSFSLSLFKPQLSL